MADGGFFGGLSEGMTSARQQNLEQQQVNNQMSLGTQRLQLEQQQMKNQQQRELYARADKDVSSLMDTVNRTVEALKLQGTDNATIAKKVQPILQTAKRLRQSSGGDPAMLDAQLAATLAQPGYNPSGTAGSTSPPATSAAQPASGGPSDIPAQPSGTGPQPPGQNITDQKIVSVEPQQNEIDRWTTAMMNLPSYAPPQMREAIKARLQNAINLNTPDASVHFMKNDDGSETPLIIKKTGANVTITDTKGNEYVPPGGTGEGGKSASQEIAEAIASGRQPPNTTGLYKQGAAVRSQLEKKGFDMTSAQLEWQAAQKQVQSLNGTQMTRYAGLAKSVVNTIDEVKSLSQELQNSGIPALNALKLKAYVQAEGNSEKGQLATRYIGAVNTLKEEFANLAQGGYAPTESAWALANQQINGDYGVKQMDAMLTEVQRLVRYRLQGIPNFQTLGPDASNRYKPGGGSGQPSESGTKSGGIPAPPAGFVVSP